MKAFVSAVLLLVSLQGSGVAQAQTPENLEEAAITAAEAGDYPQAETLWKKLLELNPQDADVYYNLGVTYGLSGRLPEAIATFSHYLTLQPNDPEGYSHLGAAYFRQGDWAEAVANYEKALTLDPTLPEIADNLAAARQKLASP
ncbi:MAG: tetratricopeptide repeat protein [Cyanobacteriota bacterium]|jgi:Flp pilus assembly protein TadD